MRQCALYGKDETAVQQSILASVRDWTQDTSVGGPALYHKTIRQPVIVDMIQYTSYWKFFKTPSLSLSSPLLFPSGPVTLEDWPHHSGSLWSDSPPPPENCVTVPLGMSLHSHPPLLLPSEHGTQEYPDPVTPEDLSSICWEVWEVQQGEWKEGCEKQGFEIHLFTETKLWIAGTWNFAHSWTYVYILSPQNFRFFEDFLWHQKRIKPKCF